MTRYPAGLGQPGMPSDRNAGSQISEPDFKRSSLRSIAKPNFILIGPMAQDPVSSPEPDWFEVVKPARRDIVRLQNSHPAATLETLIRPLTMLQIEGAARNGPAFPVRSACYSVFGLGAAALLVVVGWHLFGVASIVPLAQEAHRAVVPSSIAGPSVGTMAAAGLPSIAGETKPSSGPLARQPSATPGSAVPNQADSPHAQQAMTADTAPTKQAVGTPPETRPTASLPRSSAETTVATSGDERNDAALVAGVASREGFVRRDPALEGRRLLDLGRALLTTGQPDDARVMLLAAADLGNADAARTLVDLKSSSPHLSRAERSVGRSDQRRKHLTTP